MQNAVKGADSEAARPPAPPAGFHQGAGQRATEAGGCAVAAAALPGRGSGLWRPHHRPLGQAVSGYTAVQVVQPRDAER